MTTKPKPRPKKRKPIDIAHLTRESLLAWLASRDANGGGSEWRDNVILLLLGHRP